jgi:hypothetical protein
MMDMETYDQDSNALMKEIEPLVRQAYDRGMIPAAVVSGLAAALFNAIEEINPKIAQDFEDLYDNFVTGVNAAKDKYEKYQLKYQVNQ